MNDQDENKPPSSSSDTELHHNQLSEDEVFAFRVLVVVVQWCWRGITSVLWAAIIGLVTGAITWLSAHADWHWPWNK